VSPHDDTRAMPGGFRTMTGLFIRRGKRCFRDAAKGVHVNRDDVTRACVAHVYVITTAIPQEQP
jgi:hypothetical protein